MEFKEIKQSAACGVQKITSAAAEKVKNSREQSTKFVNRIMDVTTNA